MGKRQYSLKDISSFYVYIKSDITRMAEITLPHSPDKVDATGYLNTPLMTSVGLCTLSPDLISSLNRLVIHMEMQ